MRPTVHSVSSSKWSLGLDLLPLVPSWLADKFSWLTGFLSGTSENSLLIFLLIGMVLSLLNGTYHLKLQKEAQDKKIPPQKRREKT